MASANKAVENVVLCTFNDIGARGYVWCASDLASDLFCCVPKMRSVNDSNDVDLL